MRDFHTHPPRSTYGPAPRRIIENRTGRHAMCEPTNVASRTGTGFAKSQCSPWCVSAGKMRVSAKLERNGRRSTTPKSNGSRLISHNADRCVSIFLFISFPSLFFPFFFFFSLFLFFGRLDVFFIAAFALLFFFFWSFFLIFVGFLRSPVRSFVYLFACSFVYLFACSFVYLFIFLFFYFFIFLFVCLFACLFARLFICWFVYLFFSLFVRWFVCLLLVKPKHKKEKKDKKKKKKRKKHSSI